jgi:hypothetical protein
MKYDVEMGSAAMTYIPSFTTIGSCIQNLIRRDLQTHKQISDCIGLFYESKLKTKIVGNSQIGVRIRTLYITSRPRVAVAQSG